MKLFATRRLLTSLALACVLSTRGSSDIIVLKNGNEIQGEVLKADDRQVVVRFSGGIIRLRLKDVKEIRHQDRDQYLLEEGEKQLRRGDYAEAVKSFTEASRAAHDRQEADLVVPTRQGIPRKECREEPRARSARLCVSIGRSGRSYDAVDGHGECQTCFEIAF